MPMNRRGEYKFSAPIVAVIIGLLILVYLYFLPANDKCNLIPGLSMCAGSPAGEVVGMSPGLLTPQDISKRYSIPDAELFRIDSLDIATLFNQINIKRGWFFSEPQETSFTVLGKEEEANLFIFVGSAQGSLDVIVNGMTLSRVSGDGIKQVSIPLGILKSENDLKIVPSIPLMPWSSNSYSISKVVLRETYTKTTNKISSNITIRQDVNEIKQGILDFNSACLSDDNLSVVLNGNKIIDDKICNGFHKDVKQYLRENNTLDFMTDGNYMIENAYLDVTTKDNIWPTYYFDISSSKLESKQPVMLTLNFNGTEDKALSIYINGISISAETTRTDWKTTINKFLVEGQNSIMFVPKTEVTINSVEVN